MITYLLYKLICLLDYIDYKFIKKEKLLDNYKTTKDIDISKYNIKIYTDTGYQPISHIYNTKPFEIYDIETENGYELECADKHMLFDSNYNILYANELSVGSVIQTIGGPSKVSSITIAKDKVSMCDITVEHRNHRYYTNGILSHNSVTTAIYCLWKILFNVDKAGLILSKSGPAGVDLLKKIKDMYLYLPYYLKCGTLKWNQSEISFDNNSSISTESFSETAGLGKTINFLILDEFAWCPANEVDLFYQNIIPTITTMTDSNVCIMSTQNGFNKFYNLWHDAEIGKSIYGPFKVDWWQVPQWNPKTMTWDKRTEAWKNEMIGVLGSEEAFYYQYGTQFATSDACLVSRERLKQIRDIAKPFVNRDDLDVSLLHKENLYWKEDFNFEELKTGWFIILCDLAEGGGGDYTVFNILKITNEKNDENNIEQIGYWYSNKDDIEIASIDFWLLVVQLFNNDRCIFSIEWNTYGALFYNLLLQLNEDDYKQEYSWRFNVKPLSSDVVDGQLEFDISRIAQYKKGNIESDIALAKMFKHRNTIPGIRFNSANKVTACSLLKLELEKSSIIINDLITTQELENFEDKNGNGTYKAAYGHDDLIMTFCQIPLLKQTIQYKNLIEEMTSSEMTDNVEYGVNLYSQPGYSQPGYDIGMQQIPSEYAQFLNNRLINNRQNFGMFQNQLNHL